MSQEWRARAACAGADPEAAFAAQGSAEERMFVRLFCRECDVAAECLAYGMDNDDIGVYGGMNRRERRKEKKRAAVGRRLAECGTVRGYGLHWRSGEPACGPCLAAHSAQTNASHKRARRARVAA